MPKRKSPSSSPSSSSSSSTTPWDAREAHLNALRAAYDKKRGTHHVIWRVSDPLTTLHDRWEVQEWSEETKKEERRKLTQEQVDTHHHAMIVSDECYKAFADCCDDITYADPRNDRADGFVMLNTYSSWCMYPVLTRQLKAAQVRYCFVSCPFSFFSSILVLI